MWGKKKTKVIMCRCGKNAVVYKGDLCTACKEYQFKTELTHVLAKMHQYEQGLSKNEE